jgi:hypothetical protein
MTILPFKGRRVMFSGLDWVFFGGITAALLSLLLIGGLAFPFFQ